MGELPGLGSKVFVLLQSLDMAELVERVRTAVVARAAQLLRKEPDAPVDYLVVDLPCTFFMLRTLRCPLHAGVAHLSLLSSTSACCDDFSTTLWALSEM